MSGCLGKLVESFGFEGDSCCVEPFASDNVMMSRLPSEFCSIIKEIHHGDECG